MRKRDLYMKKDHYYLNEYKTYLENLDRAEMTILTYIDNLISFFEWFEESNEEKFNIEKITTIDLRDFKSYLLNVKNAKPNTINLKIMSLKSFFEFLNSYGYIEKDVAKTLRKIKTQGINMPKSIDESTFRKIRREIYRNGHYREIVIIELLRHALRISSIINLKLDNIHLKERGAYITVYAKQKMRKVPINPDCRDAIKNYLEIRKNIKAPYDNLILSERKAPYSRSGIWKIIKKFCIKAGVDSDISPHTFRHYAIKKLVDEGVPLTVIANLVGHSSIQLLSDVYAVPNDEDKEIAVRKL